MIDYRLQKPNALPQDGANSIVQFLLQSFPPGQAEAVFSWDHKLTQFSCPALLLSQKITFTRIPTSGPASREPNLRQPGSEQFIVFSISLSEQVLEVAVHRWGSRTEPWSHRMAHWLTPRQSNLCQCSSPEYIVHPGSGLCLADRTSGHNLGGWAPRETVRFPGTVFWFIY